MSSLLLLFDEDDDGEPEPPAEILTGNPIGLLLALTYTVEE